MGAILRLRVGAPHALKDPPNSPTPHTAYAQRVSDTVRGSAERRRLPHEVAVRESRTGGGTATPVAVAVAVAMLRRLGRAVGRPGRAGV